MHRSSAFRARLWHQNASNPTYGHTEIDPPEKAALNSSALLFLSLFIPLHTPQKKCFSLFFPRTLPFALSPAPGSKYMEKYWKGRRRSRGANLNENNNRKIICAILLSSCPVLIDFRQLYILRFSPCGCRYILDNIFLWQSHSKVSHKHFPLFWALRCCDWLRWVNFVCKMSFYWAVCEARRGCCFHLLLLHTGFLLSSWLRFVSRRVYEA